MRDGFEHYDDPDDEWLSELEIRTMDLEKELFDLRESHARQAAETGYGQEGAPYRARQGWPEESPTRRAHARQAHAEEADERETLHHIIEDEDDDDDMTTIIHTEPRPTRSRTRSGPPSARERTQALIDRGRRSAAQPRVSRPRKKVLIAGGLAAILVVVLVFVFQSSPSWPPSVATMQSQIATACQNSNVASEPGQVNFACGKTANQILWVFALMTSNGNPSYTDAKTGRKGLEPITPTQGGEIAWSLNLHHPYNPYDPVDSLQVAARAINNIIGGATLTGSDGKPSVQPGLEGNAANCAKYTGSSALVSHAGYPSLCAQPVNTVAGQAALVADTFRQWVVGATAAQAYDVSVLFMNANNPGNPQVQAILKTLPGSA
jgi:hypothetical protein